MIITPGKENTVRKACNEAAERAQSFMSMLFSSRRCSKCECGREVSYRDGKLVCEDCGTNLDAVGYVQKYDDIFIKTTVFVDKKRFRLSVSTSNDFDA